MQTIHLLLFFVCFFTRCISTATQPCANLLLEIIVNLGASERVSSTVFTIMIYTASIWFLSEVCSPCFWLRWRQDATWIMWYETQKSWTYLNQKSKLCLTSIILQQLTITMSVTQGEALLIPCRKASDLRPLWSAVRRLSSFNSNNIQTEPAYDEISVSDPCSKVIEFQINLHVTDCVVWSH